MFPNKVYVIKSQTLSNSDMKNSTIWEAASRPLFVRSVWLEAGRRHFILDYEPKRKLTSCSNLRNKREPDRQSSVYSNFSELDEELFLVGSSKAQFQQSSEQFKTEKTFSCNSRRFSSRKSFVDHFKRRYDLREEPPSKRSSLNDISSVLTNSSHSDEKLAERVLNWLDLAGKTPLLRPLHETQAEIARKKSKKDQSTLKLQQETACSRRNDSVKHITIIFNKEGVPVRLNRPARNIDLCAVSSSAGTARRLAGNLASARLYEERAEADARRSSKAAEGRTTRPKTTSVSRNLTYAGGMGKKKSETERESSALCDAKRQLHIFMPSLPKKTAVSEDAVCSDLSKQCKINSA